MAESAAGTGVTVNSVLAGPTASEGAGNSMHDVARERGLTVAQAEEEFFEKVRPSLLLKRFETPQEVAAVVTFVASAQGRAPSSTAPPTAPKAAW